MKLLSLILSAAALTSAPVLVLAESPSAVAPHRDQVSVQTSGDVTIDVDSPEIFDLHTNGTLTVNENNAHQTHFFFASTTQVVYQVNGVNQPFDDAAKDWLRGVLAQEPPPPPTP